MTMLVFVDFELLNALRLDEGGCECSPEELISSLEDKLDAGELSIDEVRQYLRDYEAKQR